MEPGEYISLVARVLDSLKQFFSYLTFLMITCEVNVTLNTLPIENWCSESLVIHQNCTAVNFPSRSCNSSQVLLKITFEDFNQSFEDNSMFFSLLYIAFPARSPRDLVKSLMVIMMLILDANLIEMS